MDLGDTESKPGWKTGIALGLWSSESERLAAGDSNERLIAPTESPLRIFLHVPAQSSGAAVISLFQGRGSGAEEPRWALAGLAL